MNQNGIFVRRAIASAVLMALFSVPALAQRDSKTSSSSTATASARIRVGNFGKINDTYYRGAQPNVQDYADLAALGVRTVIDLTRDGRDDEPGLVDKAGMKFYRIPLTTSDRPSEGAIAQFLKIVNDPSAQPVFVHCQGGRHRTGAMTAVYRIKADGWTADQAYQEMKQFNFEGFPGHPTLKRFVYDYYTEFGQAHVASDGPAVGPVAGVAN